MRTVLFLMAILSLSACSEPLAMIPGGALSGEVSAAPADWSALADIETIQVEFRPSDPYSINIWGVGIGPDLYVATDADGTRWTDMLAADPSVRVRVGAKLQALRAVAVEDPAERAKVADAYTSKYDLDAGDNWVAAGRIYRFDPH